LYQTNLFSKNFHELINEREPELREAFDMIAQEFGKTVKISKIQEIIGDICIILALDLNEGEEFFSETCPLIPYEFNKEYPKIP
jgi:hypothetical protein